MPFTIMRLPNQPTVIITISDPYEGNDESTKAIQEFTAYVEDIPGRIYRIVDVSRWTARFEDVMRVLANDGRDMARAVIDPRMTTVIVGTSDFSKMAAQATTQKHYGYATPATVFSSIDSALAFVQSELSKESQGLVRQISG